MKVFVFLVLCLTSVVFGVDVNSFSCRFTKFNKNFNKAIVTGNMYYSSSVGVRMIVYDRNEKEVILKNDSSISYVNSGDNQCNRYALNFPELPSSTAAFTSVSSCGGVTRTCNRYNSGSNYVYSVSTSKTVPVQVDFGDWTFYLSGCSDYSAPNLATYVKSCPGKTCSMQADVVYVMDDSGSIGSANFNSFKSGIYTATNALDIRPDGVKLGAVKYSSSAVVVFNMEGNKATALQKLNSMGYTGGGTCTGDGLLCAYDMLAAYQRPGVPKVIMTFTDGYAGGTTTYCNNRKYTPVSTCMNNAIRDFRDKYGKDNVYFTSLGIGSGFNIAELLILAGGVQERRLTCTWSEVATKITAMMTQVCTNYMDQMPNCGATCKGHCDWNFTCQCPDRCEYDTSSCSKAYCTKTDSKTAECKHETIPCVSSECYDATCTWNSTCTYSPIKCASLYPASCVNNHKCSKGQGDATGRCTYSKNCPLADNDCHKYECIDPRNAQSKCNDSETDCADFKRTTEDTCLPVGGCRHTACHPNNATHRTVLIDVYTGGDYNRTEDLAGSGCHYDKVTCSNATKCFEYQVDPDSLECIRVPLVTCTDEKLNSTGVSDKNCYYSRCNDASGLCEKVDFDCGTPDPCAFCKQDTNNKCITGVSCDPSVGICTQIKKPIPQSFCYSYTCDPQTGNFTKDPWFIWGPCDYCDELTGDIIDECPKLPCENQECTWDPKSQDKIPKGTCKKLGKKCPEREEHPCEIVYCNPYYEGPDEKGMCLYQDCSDPGLTLGDHGCYSVECNETAKACYKLEKEDICPFGGCEKMNGYCDLDSGHCVYEDWNEVCENRKDDSCVEWKCNNDTGECYDQRNRHWPLGEESFLYNKTVWEHECMTMNTTMGGCGDVFSYCRVPGCNPENGACACTEVVCPPEGTEKNPCFDYYPDPELETCCALRYLPGQSDDGCGGCQMYPGNCDWLLPVPTAAIGGAVGAAIAVACVIAVVVIGVLAWIGGKKTYDLITKSKEQQMAGANDNPLFQGNEDEFVNPLNQ